VRSATSQVVLCFWKVPVSPDTALCLLTRSRYVPLVCAAVCDLHPSPNAYRRCYRPARVVSCPCPAVVLDYLRPRVAPPAGKQPNSRRPAYITLALTRTWTPCQYHIPRGDSPFKQFDRDPGKSLLSCAPRLTLTLLARAPTSPETNRTTTCHAGRNI